MANDEELEKCREYMNAYRKYLPAERAASEL
jgi:hypothetical protein